MLNEQQFASARRIYQAIKQAVAKEIGHPPGVLPYDRELMKPVVVALNACLMPTITRMTCNSDEDCEEHRMSWTLSDAVWELCGLNINEADIAAMQVTKP